MMFWISISAAAVALAYYPILKSLQYRFDLHHTVKNYRQHLPFRIFENKYGRTNRKLYWLSLTDDRWEMWNGMNSETIKEWLRDVYHYPYKPEEKVQQAVKIVYKDFNKILSNIAEPFVLEDVLKMLHYSNQDSNRTLKDIKRNKHMHSIHDMLELHLAGLSPEAFRILLQNRYSKDDMKTFIGIPVNYLSAIA